MDSLVLFSYLLPNLWSLNCQKLCTSLNFFDDISKRSKAVITLCICIWKFSFRSSGKWYFIMTFYSLISRDCYSLSSVCDINFFIWKLPKLIFMGSSCFRTFWSPKYLNFEGLNCEIRILSCFIQETYTLRKVQNQFLLFLSSWEPNLSDLMVYFCLFQNAILQRVEAKILKFSAHFSQNAIFIGCNIFFSPFGYLFELKFYILNFLMSF